MDFRVLGPIRVSVGGAQVELGAPRNRSVLGLLVARAGDLLPIDELIDELWPNEPPADARTLAQGYVSRVRRALRPDDSAARRTHDRIVTRRPGYILVADDDEIDHRRFEQLVAEASQAQADGRLEAAVACYGKALREWKGEPFADVCRTPALVAEAARLNELRLRAHESRFEGALALGASHDLVPELTKLVAQHPLRGRLIGQLMLALHRSARPADAMDLYLRVCRKLESGPGIPPPEELQRIYLEVLNSGPGGPVGVPRTTSPAARTVPHR